MQGNYSLSDVLERMYTNQLALEAALMELTLHVEQQGAPEVGDNVRGALQTIGKTPATSNRAWPNSRVRVQDKLLDDI